MKAQTRSVLLIAIVLILLVATINTVPRTAAATLEELPPPTATNSGLSKALANRPAEPAPNAIQDGAVSFTHGLASGEVSPTGATVWTRINQTATITVELSLDPAFSTVAFQQAVTTSAAEDFTAKVQAGPLNPAETYYYRWLAPLVTSEVGTFKTAPPPDVPAGARFAYSGDSDGTKVLGLPFYNNFEALDAARQDGLDFFVYLGDTVYSDSQLRLGGPAETLDEYRETYKVNREIQALPDLLAAASTYVIWDDHEVHNDFDGQTVDPVRYANGRQAFLEYMPIQDASLPSDATCAGDPLFQTFSWGADVDLIILDERSCRSPDVEVACPFLPGIPDPLPTLPPDVRDQLFVHYDTAPGCLEAINDPGRTFLGPVQKQLFKEALLNSTAKYKFVINELPIQQFYVLPYDRWEGYAAEREEILNFIRDNRIENVIFLTTDIHANLANEVFVDNFDDPQAVAYEFVTGPIATTTLEEAVLLLLGAPGVEALHDVLDLVDADCRQLDTYSYGLVEVDAADGSATITLKDDTGAVLVDQRDPAVTCTATFRPQDLFLPVTVQP